MFEFTGFNVINPKNKIRIILYAKYKNKFCPNYNL